MRKVEIVDAVYHLLKEAVVGKFQLEPLLNDVVETLAKLLSAEACSVYLIDDDGMLRIKAGAGYSKRLLAPGEHRVKGGEVVKTPAEYRLGEGVTGSIAKEGGVYRTTKRKIHRDNPGWKGKYDEVQWPRGGRCISFLGIPLKVRDMVIGVLKVENKKRGEDFVESFTKDDETLMEILGNIVAISVENVRTSEDAALSAERMQAWHGVSAAAAHRLGNILPYTEARLKDARNGRGDVKELLSLCYEDIRSAMRILADFKTFARPPEIRPVPISLRELFGTVSELSRAEGVETEIDWPEGDCRLVLDPFAMKLIFLNLITNTREAKPNKPKARLSAEISEDSVRIAYCDNGPGIPEQEKSKIFEPFFTKGRGELDWGSQS